MSHRYHQSIMAGGFVAERRILMGKQVKISEMPDGKTFDDYPEDTLFVWDEGKDDLEDD